MNQPLSLSISRISEMTNFSQHTLRYYEKMGILPKPERNHGKDRKYSQRDLNYLKYIKTLKELNMPLKDIKEFLKEGCLLEKMSRGENLKPPLNKRIRILSSHLATLEQKKKDLEITIKLTKNKIKEFETRLSQEEQN
ncbi:MerR family transcriptional regulator [Leptospira sp. FAT2]|uniref:MerR family transcriptional regulator n=1 Tax=Leptospira sanjuanensis TaxID=2879643 RepID=UPI001EE9718B|nr:MerR family transcriptional regulator [Leptospira sanjuanensis]MCG6194867.1 MerR family transcriptional regulator [Leptospira sanjuanensis]